MVKVGHMLMSWVSHLCTSDVSSLSCLDTHTWTLSSAIVQACRGKALIGNCAYCPSPDPSGAMLSPGLIRLSEPMLEVELQCEHVKAVTSLLEHRRADIVFDNCN